MDPAYKWKRRKEYPTIDAGIDAAVGTMAKIYNRAGGDLPRMGEIYAPTKGVANDPKKLNQHWLPGVGWHLKYFNDRY